MPRRLTAGEFLERYDEALEKGYIFAYYQPQYNHSTGRMTGAEALMRWQDPVDGMQYPSDFIPVLEENDILYRADIQMARMACRFQRYCIDNGVPTVPISFNMSRNDIYKHDYVEEVERIRAKYDVPVRFIRVELTETSAIGGMELVSSVIRKFHDYGYVVEMDDFGSGYSSLNILKDLDVDVIKLDLNFINGDIGGRGGIILRSIVQMTKWLKTPIIAEGVETLEQADFMKSIGSNYVQGYLYSKPVPEKEFLEKLIATQHEATAASLKLVDTFDAEKFWDPNSLETLIFNNYVGGAAIFFYKRGEMEIIRVNHKYVAEIGMNISEKNFIDNNPWKYFDPQSRTIYEQTITRAIESGEEERCDTWRVLNSKCCGEDRVCIRTFMRVIGRAEDQYIIYALVHNVTKEKINFEEVAESERRFRHASEHANIYAWEYDIATREMRPCFRCIRDLGLPPLLKDYPEPAIAMGIFPPDYADMYREWHRRLEEGEPFLEAVIPLTRERVPFIVRYTTEFDENGNPIKAYGSATYIEERVVE